MLVSRRLWRRIADLLLVSPGFAAVGRFGGDHLVSGMLVDLGLGRVPREFAMGTAFVGRGMALFPIPTKDLGAAYQPSVHAVERSG